MSIDDDIAFLERVPMLAQLGGTALRILAIGAESYSVNEGETLFAPGDSADCAYVVQHGSFALKPETANGIESIAEPGSLLGESALVIETPRSATATAREDSLVLRISRAMFLKMLESNPEAAQRLRTLFASRADQLARDFEKVHAMLARGTGPQ
ncbi:MAG TPA: cyclic nucleotide-binding domain-containing protein [Xanthobacteraceae bacterium]|nr:cyclic nucleotide-binding domain-containing protein [Xanthobacteraceae bacterium]